MLDKFDLSTFPFWAYGASLLHLQHLFCKFLLFLCQDFFHSGSFSFPFGPPEHPPPPKGSVYSQLTKRVKHYNYCRCWNVDPIFLRRRLPLGYICNTFLLATGQLFPSSAYFNSIADLMEREYALMLKVSQQACANLKQMTCNWSYFHRLYISCSRITVCLAVSCESQLF